MRTKLSGYEDKKKIDGYTPGVLEYKAKYAAAFFMSCFASLNQIIKWDCLFLRL